MELNQAIQKIIDDNDVNVLTERRFLTLLNDYQAFEDMPFAASMLRQIYNNGYGTKIHKIYCNQDANEVAAFLSELRNKFGFDIVMLRKVFGEFGFPIVSKQKSKSNRLPTTLNGMSVIEGRLEDEYGGMYSFPNAEIFYGLKENIVLYNIKDCTKLIYNGAFKDCQSLVQVLIPNSVVAIGDEAFAGCKHLQQVVIPDSVTIIGNNAFANCTSLQQISFPTSVISIGNGAFTNCKSLRHISLPNSVTSIGDEAFAFCSSLRQFVISNSVANIGRGAFSFCTSLQQVTIPNTVKSIEENTFDNCTSLQQIAIPSSVTSIGDKGFANCTVLKQITISSSVTSIGKEAFRDCISLNSIYIPSSVAYIGNEAFSGCGCSITFEAETPLGSLSYNVFGVTYYDRVSVRVNYNGKIFVQQCSLDAYRKAVAPYYSVFPL